jgi:hypothetical protein
VPVVSPSHRGTLTASRPPAGSGAAPAAIKQANGPAPVASVRSAPPIVRARVAPPDQAPAAHRAVQVHIGTIEIQAAPARTTEPSAPVPAPPPAATPRGSFDDFVGLRTYAPWSW